MSDVDVSPPIDWIRPCTVADPLAIESLPDDLRGAVERYTRSRAPSKGNPIDPQYVRGWKDGAEAMRDEIEMTPIPSPPSRSR